MKSILLSGGGTAGHVMPNVALIPYLKKHFDKIYYLGEKDSFEERTCKQNKIDFYPIKAIKFRRDKLLKNFSIPYRLYTCVKEAKKKIKELSPDIIFVKGGYVSLPVAIAGKELGIPIVCHESDKSMGLANKVISLFAKAIITSWEGTHKKEMVLGNPIRDSIFEGKEIEYPFKQKQPVVLVTGGSLGAKAINDALKETIALLPCFNFCHIHGKSPIELKANNYYALDYTDRIQDYYNMADLVVCRGGACTLSELTALGKRVLCIPLPQGASRGDQLENANWYKTRKLIKVLNQEELTANNFAEAIKECEFLPPIKPFYNKNTAKNIADFLAVLV